MHGRKPDALCHLCQGSISVNSAGVTLDAADLATSLPGVGATCAPAKGHPAPGSMPTRRACMRTRRSGPLPCVPQLVWHVCSGACSRMMCKPSWSSLRLAVHRQAVPLRFTSWRSCFLDMPLMACRCSPLAGPSGQQQAHRRQRPRSRLQRCDYVLRRGSVAKRVLEHE